MIADAGHADTTFELISIDDGYRKDTTDAVAAQLRDAGFNVDLQAMDWQTLVGRRASQA